jgi:micrococcal nuclease
MRSKDIRRLLSFLTLILAIGISIVTSEDPAVIETAEEGQVDVASESAEERAQAVVQRVVDGDTIVVRIDGADHKVRFIGLNAPESVDPRRADQCFSHEASEYMVFLTGGATVTLIEDESQGDVDTFGRLLRYVEKDGVDIAEKMIHDGYAFEYTYKGSVYERQGRYSNAEADAETMKRGLWAAETCNGKL